MHIANDTTPTVKPMSATMRAYRTIDWVTARMAERGQLSASQRAERAVYYDERASRYTSIAETYPPLLEYAGLNKLAANLMRDPLI